VKKDIRDGIDYHGASRLPLGIRGVLEPHVSAERSIRRTFIGREPQLRQLREAFDAASAGHGSLAVVVGEPGIGKTALCEQLAGYVTTRGGRTLVGHCYEPGSGGTLPYLPFVEALRGYLLSQSAEALLTELGSSATELARIIPELRGRLQIEPDVLTSDREEARWRLLQAVSDVISDAAATPIQAGLLLVLEDLHWADRGTLDLLVHLGRSLASKRVLVVGTYRDIEVGRTHPLISALTELRRMGDVHRLELRGLIPAEVYLLVTMVAGQDAPRTVAETVHRQTEGNPLFVQEILRYLVEERHINQEAGYWQSNTSGALEGALPAGLRDVISKRLFRLSPQCVRLLAIASVIGRDFRLDTLQEVANLDDETTIVALEEATGAGVLEEQGRMGFVRYRFAHALFRQSLYEALSAPRRNRVHREVARVLERQNGDRLADHAAELAEHFAHSSDADDQKKAIRYGELAAIRAMGVYAYSEAVRCLEQALEVQEGLDPNDKAKQCDLLLALGEAQMPLSEPKIVADTIAPASFALAEALGDEPRASRACHMALEALHRDNIASAGTPEFQYWAERANAHALPGSLDRAYTDIALGRVRIAEGNREAGVALLRRALTLARELDDPELLFTAAWQCIWNMLSPRYWQEAMELAVEFSGRSREGAKNRTQGQLLEFCGAALLHSGDRDGAERVFRELSVVARQTRDASNQLQALSLEGLIAVLDGRLEDAVALGDHLIERAEALSMPRFADLTSRGRSRALIYTQGTADRLQGGQPASQAVFLAYAGHQEKASAALAEMLLACRTASGEVDALVYARVLVQLLEAAVVLGDRHAAGAIAPLLADCPGANAMGAVVSYQRLVGAAYALLEEPEHARRHYRQAIESCTRMRFRPELALCHLELAELLFTHFHEERGDAQTCLEFATAEFRAMNMVPALKRALAVKEGKSKSLFPPSPPLLPGGLTERELEILRLVAAGKSSRQISEELVLSVRTVDRHISNVYRKLDVRTRAQATAYAHRHGLLAAD
jgi:DNA-binding CsgD family transcriptional regulator/tetratricopeptide (TPR) repeat protein